MCQFRFFQDRTPSKIAPVLLFAALLLLLHCKQLRPETELRSALLTPGPRGSSQSNAALLQSRTPTDNLPDPIVVNPARPPGFHSAALRRYNSEWKWNYQNGVRLWGALQRVIRLGYAAQCPNIDSSWQTYRAPASFSSRFDRQCEDGGLFARLEDDVNAGILQADKPLCEDGRYDYFISVSRQGLPEDVDDEFHYANWYSTSSGIIVKDFNRDNVNITSLSRASSSRRKLINAPTPWHEIAFATWETVCERRGIKPSVLALITDMSVDVATTLNVVHQAITNDRRIERDRFGKVSLKYTASSLDFYALLGTHTGQGVVRLLTNYAEQFAKRNSQNEIQAMKSIETVSFLLDDQWDSDLVDMAFTFKDVAPG